MSVLNLDYDYDKRSDVLYVSIGKPRPSYCEDLADGTMLRYDMETDELTGITILDFAQKQRNDQLSAIDLPIAIDFKKFAATKHRTHEALAIGN
ncbi:MAG: DUF2283 domain-containing protein [Clostridiales bacterium]|jgi:uncharacterized protein YuzE|nr:DUF2283 domain-containing protein [Clostridiales bacterium]